MRKTRFTEGQIIGVATSDLCCKHGLSAATFYKYKAKFGRMPVSAGWRIASYAARSSAARYFRTDAKARPRLSIPAGGA